MALLDAGAAIGPNSLEMIPFDDQEYGDFCTGEILIAAEIARADFQSTYATGDSVSGYGAGIQQEVIDSQPQSTLNLASQTAVTQQIVDALSSPVISDQAISAAPSVYPVGSPETPSPFTNGQTGVGHNNQTNWAETLTLQGSDAAKARKAYARRAARQMSVPIFPSGGPVATPLWGSAATVVPSSISPLGKVLLFGGLGLIGLSFFKK